MSDQTAPLPTGDQTAPSPTGDQTAPSPTGDQTAPSPTGDPEPSTAEGEQWRVVTVAGVSLELPGVHPEVLLREVEPPGRQLRIPVGFAEGTAIAYAWRAIPTPRPLTHQLLADLLDRHGVEVAALRITGKEGSVYLAELETSSPRRLETVLCRPSDGLALVLRCKMPTPILVAESLLSG